MTDEHIDKWFAEHEITEIYDSPIAFRCAKPGTGIYSFNVVFLPTTAPSSAIGIVGDVMYGNTNGLWSCFGYGLDWFCGKLSRGYLAEKFLTVGSYWEPEWAAKELRYLLENQYFKPECGTSVLELIEELEHGSDMTSQDLYRQLTDIDPGYCCDGVPGHKVYHPDHVDILAGVQRCFARLYNAELGVLRP